MQQSPDPPVAFSSYHQTPIIQLEQQTNESDNIGEGDNTTETDVRERASSTDSTHNSYSKYQDDIQQRDDTIRVLDLQCKQLEKSLGHIKRQCDTTRKENISLNSQVRDLSLQITEGTSQLKRQVATLTAEKRQLETEAQQAHEKGMKEGMRTQCAQNERVILYQQVEAYKNEAAKWKQEALGQGSEVLNLCWQASVDEAVRRKREMDEGALQTLQNENAALKAEKRK